MDFVTLFVGYGFLLVLLAVGLTVHEFVERFLEDRNFQSFKKGARRIVAGTDGRDEMLLRLDELPFPLASIADPQKQRLLASELLFLRRSLEKRAQRSKPKRGGPPMSRDAF